MPASSMASTKGAALPSMIGSSPPSISISTLSMFMPRSAESRCSTVATVAPLRVAQNRAERDVGDCAEIGGNAGDAAAAGIHQEGPTRAGFGRMQNDGNLSTTVDTSPGQNQIAIDRRLPSPRMSFHIAPLSFPYGKARYP